jgi:hypothetical protein
MLTECMPLRVMSHIASSCETVHSQNYLSAKMRRKFQESQILLLVQRQTLQRWKSPVDKSNKVHRLSRNRQLE